MSGSPLQRRTFPVIFAAPSGAGKTTIAQELRGRRPDALFSISATTRPPRPYEQDGVDYYFHSMPDFRRMIEAGELLEWAEVHGNFYGTPRRNLEKALACGQFLILDIDVQGSRQVRQEVPEAVSIFVLPPSGRELARRLTGRGSEPEEVRARRLRAARDEILSALEFDYVIVNEDVATSVAAVERIMDAEGMRSTRFPRLGDFVEHLRAEVDECLGASATGSEGENSKP